jgi:hypothetical protein
MSISMYLAGAGDFLAANWAAIAGIAFVILFLYFFTALFLGLPLPGERPRVEDGIDEAGDPEPDLPATKSVTRG